MTKQEIKIEDIRKGDLIRWEANVRSPAWAGRASEYFAAYDCHHGFSVHGTCYLLGRKFEPKWGTVIGVDSYQGARAVYLPGDAHDPNPWLTSYGWQDSEWADGKLKDGWEVIEPPKDEKE